MNGKTLQRQYDKLSARERFSLIMAAERRGDRVEQSALLAAAPEKTFSVSHHFGTGEAFMNVALYHIIGQLEKGHLLLLLANMGDDDDPDAERMYKAAEGTALMIMRSRDAWALFCKGIGVEPTDALWFVKGIDTTLDFLESLSERMHPDPDEIRAHLQNVSGADAELASVDDLAEQYRTAFESYAARWGG